MAGGSNTPLPRCALFVTAGQCLSVSLSCLRLYRVLAPIRKFLCPCLCMSSACAPFVVRPEQRSQWFQVAHRIRNPDIGGARLPHMPSTPAGGRDRPPLVQSHRVHGVFRPCVQHDKLCTFHASFPVVRARTALGLGASSNTHLHAHAHTHTHARAVRIRVLWPNATLSLLCSVAAVAHK